MDRALVSIIVALSVISISVVIGILKYVITQKKIEARKASRNTIKEILNEIVDIKPTKQVNFEIGLKDNGDSNSATYEMHEKKLKEVLSKKSHTAVNDIDGNEIKGYKIRGGNNKYKNLMERRVA